MPFDTESMMQIIWLILLIVFAASEAATVGLTSIWFAAGALTALHRRPAGRAAVGSDHPVSGGEPAVPGGGAAPG